MTVAELVAHLKTFQQDLPVAYNIFSEQCLMEPNQIVTQELCLPREDGWVANQRPDKPTQTYLVFPGN